MSEMRASAIPGLQPGAQHKYLATSNIYREYEEEEIIIMKLMQVYSYTMFELNKIIY